MTPSAGDHRYRLKAWRQLRAQVIARDGRYCSQPGCQSDMSQPRMTFVDHIIEVQDGGPFWDINNLQVLCKPHHDAKTTAARAVRSPDRISPNA